MSIARRERMRWSGVLLLAVLLHVAIIALLGLQLPVAHAGMHERHLPDAQHPGTVDPVGPSDPFIDLTPPEVRQVGGSSLVEVLEAPPALRIPDGARPEREHRGVEDVDAPTLRLDDVRSGRAPPVA